MLRFDLLGANWKHGAPFEPPPGWAPGGGGGGPNVHYEFRGGGPGGMGGGGFSDFFESIFSGGGRPGGGRGRRPQGGMGGGIDLDDLLGGRFGGGFGGNGAQGRPSKGQDVAAELVVALEDSYLGSKKAVELSGPSGQRRYDVTIPQGIRDGEKIRLGGQGRPLPGGGAAGDLYITITIAAHPQFSVEGDDLVVRVLVPAWDAALGTKLEVPTVDGKVSMSLPAGLDSGQRLRLKGKGMPRRSGGSGDLYAELQIVVPKELSKEQEGLFKKLRKTSEQ